VNRSLRVRLLVGIVGGMTLLLVVFSLVIYTAIRRALINQFDTSLASMARILAASVEQNREEIELEFEVAQMPEFQEAERPTYYELWRPDGVVLARSPSLGADDLLRFEGAPGEPAFRAAQLRNDRPGRAAGLGFHPRVADSEEKNPPQPEETLALTLVVARDAGDMLRHLEFLRWLLLVASVGTITLSVLVAAVVVRRGLCPLNSLAAEIAAITEDDLNVRVGTEKIPAEIMPIKNRLNELLARLGGSFARERRFAADVAHELRTPLAGIRSTLEVTLTRTRRTDEYQTALCDCLDIAKNMQAMVNNLLTLARIEAKQTAFRCEQIRLAELIDSSWRPFSAGAAKRGIVFENRVPAHTTCQSDRESLSIVFSNILDNAVEYANEAGRIWTTARQTDGCVEITVSNTGCRLTSEQAAHVFDCLWRCDPARTETPRGALGAGNHCGLGLALVQRIITALGGRASVEVQSGGIFTIRLILQAE